LLTNAKLKSQTLGTVTSIRSLLEEYQSKNNELFSSRFSNFEKLSEEERHRHWVEETNKSTQLLSQLQAAYNSKYKINAILLRDELLSRLPKEITKDRNDINRSYENVVNTLDILEVADDLERLSKLLPPDRATSS